MKMEITELKALTHPIAKEIVEATSSNSESTFYKQKDTNLISLLSFYVHRTTKVSQFKEIIIGLKRLLDGINTSDDLRKLSEGKDEDIKELWKTDAFFHTSKGWEEHEDNAIKATLLSVKKRIDYLYSQIRDI